MTWQIKFFGLLRAITPFVVISIAVAGFVICVGYLKQQAKKTTTFQSVSVPITLWAWERDEDLSFLKGQDAEVAYYAGTFFLNQSSIHFRPRLNKLTLPLGVTAYPVFRFEYRRKDLNSGTVNSSANEATAETSIEERSIRAVDEITKYQSQHPCNKLQLDFDAVEEDRTLYSDILHRLRLRARPNTYISITSLASWCLDDQWLERADIDEAVAMLFSMGPSGRQTLGLIKKERLHAPKQIKLSVGLSVNEPLTNQHIKRSHVLEHAGRLYIFSTRPWTRTRLQSFINQIGVR